MMAAPSWKLSAAVAIVASASVTAGVLLLSITTALAQPAPNARPTGGIVTAGNASISYGPGVVTITSSSERAAIDWESFDIGANQQVVFAEPEVYSSVLIRVNSPNLSQIAGSLNPNGQVILVNQSGAIYYQGAQVDVSGFISAAANISDANFMAGRLVFDQAAKPDAFIENHDEIKISDAGFLALVAPRVSNSGVLRAPLGHIVLAFAKTATLDLYGDGLLSLDVSNEVTQAPLGPNGAPTDPLVNTGTIRARGGTVQLTGRIASGLVASIRVGGVVRTKSIGAKTGTIVVDPVGISEVVTGTLDASGTQAGDLGGSIQVDANGSTELAATSVVNVQGEAGGGTVAIGTTLARAKGGPVTPAAFTSQIVLVDEGARISADALAAGNGGRVAILSSQSTTMAGTISARGAQTSGNGGFVEISGNVLSLTGIVDNSAPAGQAGTLLLDPFDFIITPSVANALSAQLFAGRSGKLIIQADHDIEVDAAIDGRGGVPGTQLVFNAGHQVRFNADVFTNDAPVEVDAGAGGVLASPGTALCAGVSSITVKSEGSTDPQEPYAVGSESARLNARASCPQLPDSVQSGSQMLLHLTEFQ